MTVTLDRQSARVLNTVGALLSELHYCVGAGSRMTVSSAGGAAAFGGVIGVLVLIGLYLLPTIIAVSRKVANVGSVAVINVLLGWTFIGWVVALAMAARSRPTDPVSSAGPVSPEHVQVPYSPTPPGQTPGRPAQILLPPSEGSAEDQTGKDAKEANCPNGHRVPDGASFCPACGARLEPTRRLPFPPA
jgi:hypothetical protein